MRWMSRIAVMCAPTKTASMGLDAALTLTLSPTSIKCAKAGCSYNVSVTTNGTWSWNSGFPSWVALSRSGNTIKVVVAANNSNLTRTGSITVTAKSSTVATLAKVVAITQQG